MNTKQATLAIAGGIILASAVKTAFITATAAVGGWLAKRKIKKELEEITKE